MINNAKFWDVFNHEWVWIAQFRHSGHAIGFTHVIGVSEEHIKENFNQEQLVNLLKSESVRAAIKFAIENKSTTGIDKIADKGIDYLVELMDKLG